MKKSGQYDTERIAGSWFCPACKFPVEDFESSTCLVCGFELTKPPTPPPVVCEACGTPVTPGQTSCAACGSSRLAVSRKAPAKSVRGPHLVSYSIDGKKEVYPVIVPKTRVGRQSDNDIAFPNEKSISGRHCEIVFQNGQFVLRDLNSTNGVFVNGEKIRESPIHNGDKVKLGVKMFRFEEK
ncbi:MAG: FHA domain-containing protein [Acidobacteria bacterium]|nr:FHA domain-containing protein [Acidobacteriota bacterium]